MNPCIELLQPYPFERLRRLFEGLHPAPAFSPIRLSIGEPRHPSPHLIRETLAANLGSLSQYPSTQGSIQLREAIAAWLQQRHGLHNISAEEHILVANGSREALFAFTQCVIDHKVAHTPVVVCPNPFYQIYEGSALLAAARPVFVNALASKHFRSDFTTVSEDLWRQTQMVFVCSPANPTGRITRLEEWQQLFELADRYDFIIASDECYSEIYFDEANPPLGALAAAQQLGRSDYQRLMIFSSLSKRSNVPGLRSGFVAGDPKLIAAFLRYRTYHGCTMAMPTQLASCAAWEDETHVIENRRLYREKFERILPLLSPWLRIQRAEAGFYLWAETPIAGTDFARALQAAYNVTVLPGSFLARESAGVNPASNFVRIALVDDVAVCIEAAERIALFCSEI